MSRIIGLALTIWVVGACFGDNQPHNPIPTADQTPDSDLTPQITDFGRSITTDGSGRALTSAVRTHIPTDRERRLVAGFILLLIKSERDGVVSPALISSPILSEVLALARMYPEIFAVRAPTDGGTRRSAQPVVSSPADFSCTSDCNIAAGVFSQTAHRTLNAIVTRATAGLGSVPKLYESIESLVSTAHSIEEVDRALEHGLTLETTGAVLHYVGDVVVAAGAAAAVATALGASAPILATIAEVGATVGLVMIAVDVAHDIAYANWLSQACNQWHTMNCAGDVGEDDAVFDLGETRDTPDAFLSGDGGTITDTATNEAGVIPCTPELHCASSDVCLTCSAGCEPAGSHCCGTFSRSCTATEACAPTCSYSSGDVGRMVCAPAGTTCVETRVYPAGTVFFGTGYACINCGGFPHCYLAGGFCCGTGWCEPGMSCLDCGDGLRCYWSERCR